MLADGLFSGNVRTNGVLVGVATPKTQDTRAPVGLPDLTTTIENVFSARDKILTRLVWRETPYRSISRRQGHRQAGGDPGLVVWRFEDGTVTEISTIQDQFTRLKQIGYLSAAGICPA